MFSKTFLLEDGCIPTIYQEGFDFKCSRPDEVVVLYLVLVVVETWILLVASVVTMVELQSCSLALHCVTTCILKLKIGQKFSCMTINFNLQAHGTRPTQESFFFSRPTLFFWVWVCKELLRLVEPSGHWSRREPSQLLSRDLLQWLCRSSSDVKTNTNTQKCKV